MDTLREKNNTFIEKKFEILRSIVNKAKAVGKIKKDLKILTIL